MSTGLEEAAVHCPYCGETVTLLVDESVSETRYFEDCSVCCRPILVSLSASPDGGCRVDVRREDD